MDGSCNKKHPVLAVVGPTASGKTALGVALAEQFGVEIISADSMQIYKGLDVVLSLIHIYQRQRFGH